MLVDCNGSTESEWGKKRAESGHPEPFNLKYIGIGNEDLISDIFKERFLIIYNSITEKYPDITVIGTVGPFFEGSDYVEGWKFATELEIEIVDEHYYQKPGWFVNNQDFYDKYDRSRSKVYLGEYASRGNSLYNALSEAIYLTAIERNGDVVQMASYAPLLARDHFTQWRTDLIFFNGTTIKPTPNYEVQKLFGQNSGNIYINSTVQLSNKNIAVRKRIGVSIVRENQSGDIIVKFVNLLPVDINSSINFEGLKNIKESVLQTTLKGNPDDRRVLPETKTISLNDISKLSIPAYSVSVIRFKIDLD